LALEQLGKALHTGAGYLVASDHGDVRREIGEPLGRACGGDDNRVERGGGRFRRELSGS